MTDELSYITENYLAGASCVDGVGAQARSFKMVRVSGNYARVVGTANGIIHGVLLNTPVATGDMARVLLFGKSLVRVGESGMVAGETFVSSNSGRGITTASTAASNTLAYFGGRLLRSATSDIADSLVSALVMPWQGFL